MGRLTVREASALDLFEAVDDEGRDGARRTRRGFSNAVRQLADGYGVTIRAEGGRLCMVVGLWVDDGEEAVEAWFAAGPALRANFRAACTLARQMLETTASDMRPLTVSAFIHPGSVAGSRIAAWFGFEAAGVGETWLGPMERWTRRFP